MKKTVTKNDLKINLKKIGDFLKSITPSEYIYMGHCMSMRDAIQKLIERHKLGREYVCEQFKITPNKYNDFIQGAYNYSVSDMSTLNYLFVKHESEKLKEKVPVQFTSDTKSKK